MSVLLVFLQLLFFDIAFTASENNEEEGVYTLGEIVVQGKTEGVEATGSVYNITAEDIQDSGARNVAEAMEFLPGIDIFTGGNGTPRINIRGFRTRHVLLLLDGVPINSAYDQQFDASLIPVEHIARIKMTIGPSSVLYGQGGAGGVINIITKKGTKKIRGTIGGEMGDGGYYLGKASLSGGGKKADFFLSGSVTQRDAFPLSDDFDATDQEDGGDRENSDNDRKNFFANVGYKINDTFRLGLTFSYLYGEYGIPGSVINDASDPFAKNPKYERIDDFKGFSLQMAGEYCPSDFFSLRSWAFINQMEQQDNRYFDELFDSWISRYNQKTDVGGISMQPVFNLGEKGTLAMGFFFERDQWESEGEVKDHLAGWPPEWVVVYPENDKDFDIYNLSIEYEFMPIPELGLVFGYGRHRQDRDEGKDDENSVLVGAHYDMTDSLRLKAAFQKNIRFPSLRQFYDDNSGNEDLKTERVNHYTIGMELKLPGETRITLNGFQSDARDFIEKDKGKFDNPYENFDKYQFRGAEIAAETYAIERLMVRGSYFFLHTKDLSDSGKDELQNRPENRITFESKYTFDFDLSSYVSVLYVADQYYYTKNPPYEKAESKSYTLVNVKLIQKILNDRFNLYVGADNVFDRDYAQSYGLPQAGRFVYGGMEAQF